MIGASSDIITYARDVDDCLDKCTEANFGNFFISKVCIFSDDVSWSLAFFYLFIEPL